MTQEEKELLIKDIFGRVLTGIKVNYNGEIFTLGYNLYLEDGNVAFESYPMKFYLENIEIIKPYLRPMSSMTEEERNEYRKAVEKDFQILEDSLNASVAYMYADGMVVRDKPLFNEIDWLNKKGFDYRGLIPMGLALEAPKDMYKF